MTDFKMIPVAEIHPDPNQPRRMYDETSMAELTQSVKEKGILQPILLRPNGKGYILVCGERRYRASKEAGLTEIPSVIRHLSDEEALELQIIENLQRKDVHPMEEAVAFKSLVEKKHWTPQEIAHRVGKKDTYIRQRLKLSDLVPEWQKMFYKNAFTLHEALELCMLPEKQQKEFYKNEVDANDEKADHPKISINSYQLNQYKGDLHKAIFDLQDPTLDKKMGPCTTCQFNTACMMLFSDAKQSPRCMNASCFKHKTDIYFDRTLKIAKEDPEIILVNTGSGESGLIQKLKKEGHHVLREYHDYSSIEAPDKPDWEEYKDDNWDDDIPEQQLRKDFEKELIDFDKEFVAWQKKVSTGKYKKAFVVDGYGDDKGKYIFIELKKKSAQADSKKAVESGTADVSDIDEEIRRIRERETRSKELDGEKVFARVKEVIASSKDFISEKRNCELTEEEITASVVTLFNAGGYDFKKWFKKHLGFSASNYYSLSATEVQKINLTAFGLNEILWHFIKHQLFSTQGSHLTDGAACAVYGLAKYYHPNEVYNIELEQQETATKRKERVASRIQGLQAQKKELQSESKPKKSKTSKAK